MHPIPCSKDQSDMHSWAFYAQETPVSEELRREITTSFWDVREEVVSPHRRMRKGESPFWGFANWMKYRNLATEWVDEVCELGKGAYRVTYKPGHLVNENVGVPGSGSIALPLRCLATPALYRPLPVLQNLAPYRTWLATEVCIPLRLSFTDCDLWLREGGVTIVRTEYDDLREVEKTEGSPKTPESQVAYLCDDPMCVHCDKNPKVKPTPRKSRIRDLVNENWKRERCMSCEEYRLCEPQTGLCMACVSGLAEEHS